MSHPNYIIKPEDVRSGDLDRGLGIGLPDNVDLFFREAQKKDIILIVLIIFLVLYMGGGFLTLAGYTAGNYILMILRSKWFWVVFLVAIIAFSLIK